MATGITDATIVTATMFTITDFINSKTGKPTIPRNILNLKNMQSIAINIVATIVYSGSAPKYNKINAIGKFKSCVPPTIIDTF